jgi:O-antigen ligase
METGVARRDGGQRVAAALAVALLCIPWLTPFTPGPSPGVVPWLVAAGCAAILMAWLATGFAFPAERWTAVIARAWLLAGVLSCVIALVQYLGHGSDFAPWINRADLGIAFANLRQRNQFATLTMIAFAALLWFVQQRDKTMPLWGASAVALVLAVGNSASSSRAGLLEFLVVLALAALWRSPPRIRRLLLVYVLAYLGGQYLLPLAIGLDPGSHGAWARMWAGDTACASRWTLWGNVVDLIRQQPWRGWGWGHLDFAHYATLYEGNRFCDILDNAHNLPLHLAVELGLPAALILLASATVWMLRNRPWAETEPARQLAWTVLAMVGLHSMLEYPLWYGPFQIAVVASLAMLGTFKRMSHPVLRVMALSLGAASTYAAWDYHRISQIYLPASQRSAAYRENTLEKIQGSWLFRNQVRFAELTTTPLTRQNAARQEALALELLHFSPEPRVIQKLIEAAVMLHHDALAQFHLVRFRAAFPEAYENWRRAAAQVPAT